MLYIENVPFVNIFSSKRKIIQFPLKKNILQRLVQITSHLNTVIFEGDLYYVYTRAYFSVFVDENGKVNFFTDCVYTQNTKIIRFGVNILRKQIDLKTEFKVNFFFTFSLSKKKLFSFNLLYSITHNGNIIQIVSSCVNAQKRKRQKMRFR